MTWQVVAHKDFQDAVRSRWLWALAGIFVALVSAVSLGAGYFLQDVGSSDILSVMNGLLVTTLVPLISLVVGYGAVAGERESGSLKLLLSLPHSRLDVVVGKVVGRSAVMAVAVTVGFLLPAVVLAILVPLGQVASFDAFEFVGFTAFVVVLAAVFVAIAVGISALARTQKQAIAGALGFYFLFVTFWVLFQTVGFVGLIIISQGWPGWMPLSLQETQNVFRVVNPTGAFKILTTAFLNDALFAPQTADVRGVRPRNLQVSAVSMLLFWLLFPVLVGLWRFEETDL